MIYASTFLSHSSVDKPLVEAVARELGRRGIIAWLDRSELNLGANLSEVLKAAIERQVTTTVFLSEAAIQSPWVTEELAVAIDTHQAMQTSGNILPIFLGDPVALVKLHPLLRSWWLHADGQRVNILGVQADANQPILELAKTLADGIARRVYQALGVAAKREIILYVDQRGEGRRRGELQGVPDSVRQRTAPALVFRPELQMRRQSETLHGDAWTAFRGDLTASLAEAIENLRGPEPKSIYVLGNAQVGIAYMLGHYFNRSTSTHLFCYNRDGYVFNNQAQPRHMPLQGGNPNCEATHDRITPLPPGAQVEAVALILTAANYVDPALDYLAAQDNPPPPVWVEHGSFQENAQVMQYVTDIVALLTRLRAAHRLHRVYLFCGLPFHVIPLLAANLLNVVDDVVFMEYRRDLQGQGVSAGEMYVPLDM